MKTRFFAVLLGAGLVCSPSFAKAASVNAVAHAYIDVVRSDLGVLISAAQSSDLVMGAETFVGSMAKRGIAFLGDKDLSEEARKKEFKKLLSDSFDMNTIARFTLGRYWRTASTAQKKEYEKLFEERILEVYSQRFDNYKGQRLDVVDTRSVGKSDALVTTNIISGNGDPDIRVDWRVRYNNGRYKVIDVIVEGVSMAVTQRSDFSSVIQRGGGDISVLLEHLRNN